MWVENMDKGVEGDIVVVVQPGQKSVDVGSGCFGSTVAKAVVVDRGPFVQNLDTLVQVTQFAGELN